MTISNIINTVGIYALMIVFIILFIRFLLGKFKTKGGEEDG